MNLVLAEIFSFLFHPVIFFLGMPFFVVYKTSHDQFYAFKWGFFSALFILCGVVFILWGKKVKMFSDIDLSNKNERAKFYSVSVILALVYFASSLFFKGISFPLSIIGFGILLGTLVFGLVNYRIKASIHAASSCAFAVSLGILYGPIAFLLAAIAAVLVIWSRLTLKRHTHAEASIGGILGIILTLIIFFIGKMLYKGV